MLNQAIDWPRPQKKAFVIFVDTILALLSTWIAYSLRLEILHWPNGQEWVNYLLSPVFAVAIFWALGLYRTTFRYFSVDAMLHTARAVLCYALALIGYHLWRIWPTFPLTLSILQPIIFMLLLAASRMFAQFWLAGVRPHGRYRRRQLLIYGAGEAGAQIATALTVSGKFKLMGFLDDDSRKVGQTINGIPIFAGTDATDVVRKLAVTDIVLAIPSVTREHRNQIIARLAVMEVHVRALPSLSDLTSGLVKVKDVRELDIEDLLGREAVKPDTSLLSSKLHGQVVLVTGAGGTIGGELSRQILFQRPKCLLLLDHSEYGLYTVHRTLQGLCSAHAPLLELVPLLASVGNRDRLDWILAKYHPSIVYHAAAYKHVPMVECNPSAGILNNVFGTLNMAQASQAAKVANFLLISTDKAVRPTNLMGASKRMCELILQALAQQADTHHTCFSMVRFGNVLGSSGSVVPMFREQITAGGPLTVTHPEVTRYFMTITEATQLVLQAAAMARGGDVFVLDMGEPVKIIDLARRLVNLAGLKVRDAQHPEGDIDLAIIGLRPGEKLYEELLIGDNPSATAHSRIMVAHEDYMLWHALESQLTQLRQAAIGEDEAAIRSVLQACVHGFHQEPDTS
jgi:FlaA1/EpsC-like NDP-sugar epimerase